MKVSIITPTTASRSDHLARLYRYVHAQTYPSIEHVVVFDEGKSIGEKRNQACSIAKGEVIIMMDDDDYYDPDFVKRSVDLLLKSGASITGLSKAYFYKPHSDLWLYEYKGKQPYVIGSGMCFYKSVWEKKQFTDKNSGEDLDFQTNAGKIVPLDYLNGFMAMIHGDNTASQVALPQMKRIDPSIAKKILGESYYLYTK